MTDLPPNKQMTTEEVNQVNRAPTGNVTVEVEAMVESNIGEPLHTGKWTPEEMAYADGLIDEFKEGNLDLTDGTSLRQFLAKMLHCSPKRVSKRFEGNNYSKGRKFYVRRTDKLDPVEAAQRRTKLTNLERKYKQKLLHLKMPHLMIANQTTGDIGRDEPEEVEEDGSQSDQQGHSQRTPITEPVVNDMVIQLSNSAGSPSTAGSFERLPNSIGLPLRNTPSLQARNPNQASLFAALSSPSALGRPTAAELDNAMLSALLGNAGGELLGQQLRQQYPQLQQHGRESHRTLASTLELKRRLSLERLQRQSNLQRLLGGPSLLDGQALTALQARNQFGLLGSSNGNASQQLQELFRVEQALAAAHQNAALPYATSLAAAAAAAAPVNPVASADMNRQSFSMSAAGAAAAAFASASASADRMSTTSSATGGDRNSTAELEALLHLQAQMQMQHQLRIQQRGGGGGGGVDLSSLVSSASSSAVAASSAATETMMQARGQKKRRASSSGEAFVPPGNQSQQEDNNQRRRFSPGSLGGIP